MTGLVAGCGGGSSSSAPTTGSVAGAHKTAAQPSAMFSTANVSGLGNVLVDGSGKTVYVLTSSSQKNVPCTDASGCTALWPDLPLPSGKSSSKAGMGLEASLLGTKKLSDGETYPTYDGWLMYEYTGDSGPAQSNGEGIKSFGGIWYAISPSGRLVKSSSGGSGGSGGGGGY